MVTWREFLYGKPTIWTYVSPTMLTGQQDMACRVVKKNEDYVTIRLKSSRIAYARKGVTTYFGIVHSYVSLLHKSEGRAKFHSVNTPGNLQLLDAKKINRVININKEILGPVPYRGDKVNIEIGLLSVPADNLAKPFIELLSEISTTAGVSVINAALPFVNTIQSGIEKLTSANQNPMLEIGISISYDELYTGYYIMVSAPKGKIDSSSLTVDPNDFSVLYNGEPLEEYSYFVYEVKASGERADWFTLPDIAGVYKKLQDAIDQPDVQTAKELTTSLKLAVNNSPDILRKDAQVIFRQIEEDVNSAIAILSPSPDVERYVTVQKNKPKLRPLNEYKIY